MSDYTATAAAAEQPSTGKRKAGDVLARRQSSTTLGRGSLAGWTNCPLCGDSKKQFALGRGIAAHLHSVHAPWKKPSNKELKRRRRLQERAARAGGGPTNGTQEGVALTVIAPWEPTQEEIYEWEQRVVEICQTLELGPAASDSSKRHRGVDRTGKPTSSYRDSLPPLLKAAADGDLKKVKELMAKDRHAVASTKDRNGSIAEHWAAGSGHLECLKLLIRNRKPNVIGDHEGRPPAKKRRRDGKTSLHYAARKGQTDCVLFLLDDANHKVDETSGDGTTPLHLACYGGHLQTVKLFVETYQANLHIANDWSCGVAHWTALYKPTADRDDGDETIKALCTYLSNRKVDFTAVQKQGHSPLHKAAQTKNEAVILWMDSVLTNPQKLAASQPDNGGHRPSDIYLSGGGSTEFADYIRKQFESDEATSQP